MTEYSKGTYFNAYPINGSNVEVRSGVLKELVSTRIQLLGAPFLQTPPDGKNLQVLSDKDWVDWASLEDGLTKRMNADLFSGTPLCSEQLGLQAIEGGCVAVHLQYLVDDFWWVECLMPLIEDYHEWEERISSGSAAAVLCVKASRFNLFDSSNGPVWFRAVG